MLKSSVKSVEAPADSAVKPAPAKPKCRVPGCDNDADVCGVCKSHYAEILKMIRNGEITREKLESPEVGILLPASRTRTSKLRAALAEKKITLAPAVVPPPKPKKPAVAPVPALDAINPQLDK
jgi:hypothetical protein